MCTGTGQQTFSPVIEPERDKHIFDSGAVRNDNSGEGRYDLIPSVGLKRVAQTCEHGAVKYGPDNWLRGIPVSNLLNHALIHIFTYIDEIKEHGKPSPNLKEIEDHLAHAVWNLLAAMYMEERMPEMVDL